MNHYPVKAKRRAAKPTAEAAPDVVPARSAHRASFNFRYSYASITLDGGKAHLRAHRASSTNGTLDSESFKGDVDRALFERAVEEAQRRFAAQTALLWRAFAPWLPVAARRDSDVD
jgi:hypothetical protein